MINVITRVHPLQLPSERKYTDMLSFDGEGGGGVELRARKEKAGMGVGGKGKRDGRGPTGEVENILYRGDETKEWDKITNRHTRKTRREEEKSE